MGIASQAYIQDLRQPTPDTGRRTFFYNDGNIARSFQDCETLSSRSVAYWVRDREAVDLEQFLNALLRVETLLVGLACLVTVSLVLLGVPLDIGNGERQRGRIARTEEYAIDS